MGDRAAVPRRYATEMCHGDNGQGLGHVVEKIPAPLFAGRLDTPEPFQPAIAPIASRSLGHFTIKDDITNRRKHFLYFPDDSFAVIGDLVCVSFACPVILAVR